MCTVCVCIFLWTVHYKEFSLCFSCLTVAATCAAPWSAKSSLSTSDEAYPHDVTNIAPSSTMVKDCKMTPLPLIGIITVHSYHRIHLTAPNEWFSFSGHQQIIWATSSHWAPGHGQHDVVHAPPGHCFSHLQFRTNESLQADSRHVRWSMSCIDCIECCDFLFWIGLLWFVALQFALRGSSASGGGGLREVALMTASANAFAALLSLLQGELTNPNKSSKLHWIIFHLASLRKPSSTQPSKNDSLEYMCHP